MILFKNGVILSSWSNSDDESRPLENNYRPVQQLNTRVVSYRPSSPAA
jgi:hypothetical protein